MAVEGPPASQRAPPAFRPAAKKPPSLTTPQPQETFSIANPVAIIHLTRDAIDPADVVRQVRTPAAGAIVLFLGTVREMTAGRRTEWLEYDGYPEMAQQTLAELAAEAARHWPVVSCAIVHRLGRLELGDIAVAVAVSTPHRHDAFQAGQWVMDTLKRDVPIWKCENWADGSRQWIHPTESDGGPPT